MKSFSLLLVVVSLLLFSLPGCSDKVDKVPDVEVKGFNPETDFISLHYDHAADHDDGHSAVADRMILQEAFGIDWIKNHTAAVSGTYGENKNLFVDSSDVVMNAVWNDAGGWVAADKDREKALDKVYNAWVGIIKDGGKIWIKEGGQSDFSADIIRRIQKDEPAINTIESITLVQHSDWNEEKTTDKDLAYVKQNCNYIRIPDANSYLKDGGGNAAFADAALRDPVYGKLWKVVFDYLDPYDHKVDFSDTGELLKILGMDELTIDEFAEKYFDTYKK